VDDCIVMEGFPEYGLCNLARDESFGWPLQDPSLDSDSFGLTTDSLDFVFDPVLEACPRDWINSWPVKSEQTPVSESTWQQLAVKLNPPGHQVRPAPDDSSLIPALAALNLPKEASPVELDYVALGWNGQTDSREISHEQQHSYALGTYLGEYAEFCDEYRFKELERLTSGQAMAHTQIGAYTHSQRAVKLLRYREKRARRNFNKRVIYSCRKQFADSRPREGGRFVIDENRVVKPKMFLKRGRPRKVPLPLMSYLVAGFDLK